MIGKSCYSWCTVSVFGIAPVFMGWENEHLSPPGNWVQERKISRKPEVGRLIDLILAVFCRYNTHTAQEPGSLFWFHAVRRLLTVHYIRYMACRVQMQIAKLGSRLF